MTDKHGTSGRVADASPESDAKIPIMQNVLDNPFLLLFIGVAVPTIFYLIWGIMDIILIPISK